MGKAKKKRGRKLYHVLGELDEEGERKAVAVESCEEGKEPEQFIAYPTSSGMPLLPGAKLGKFEQVDEDHVAFEEHEDVDNDGESRSGSGPAQVATPVYRNGWSRTFGKN